MRTSIACLTCWLFALPAAAASGTPWGFVCTLPDGSQRFFAQDLRDFPMSLGTCQRDASRQAVQPTAPWVAAAAVAATPRAVEVRDIHAPPAIVAKPGQPPRTFEQWVEDACQRHGISPALAWAVMFTESRYRPDARSPKGALGLMQIMRATGARYGVHSEAGLLDPQANIEVGVRYLRDLAAMFPGRIDLVVAAYNAGEGAVMKHGYNVPPYAETRQYVRNVLSLLDAGMPQP